MKKITILLLAASLMLPPCLHAQDTYKKPDKVIEQLVLAKPMPTYYFSKDCGKAIVGYRNCQYVPLATLAGPEMRIGGIRFNPFNNSQTRENLFDRIVLVDYEKGYEYDIKGIPSNARIKDIVWSPNGRVAGFINVTDKETELWLIDAICKEPYALKINKNKVNAILGNPYKFIDDETIIYKSVPKDMGPLPKESLPLGPVVQQNLGKKAAARTYEDLISSPFDEKCYEYYCTSQFSIYTCKKTTVVGPKSIFRSYELSPDKKYIMVTTEHKPYSYTEGHRSFPSRLEIWDINGNLVKVLRDGTKEEEDDDKESDKPKRKSFDWRADKGATLTWIESVKGIDDPDFVAKDSKDKPGKIYVNRLYQTEAPFDLDKKELVLAPKFILENVAWGDDMIALYSETSAKNKLRRVSRFIPCDTVTPHVNIFTASTEIDTMGNFPVYGKPYTVNNVYGSKVLKLGGKGRYLYFTGTNRPDEEKDQMEFIDRYDIKEGTFEQMWMGSAPDKVHVVNITDFNKLSFLARIESNTDAPNYYLVNVHGKRESRTAITEDEDAAKLNNYVERRFITYKRADGVTLTSNLYLPKGYDPNRDGKLPVLIWAYPREYKCAASAEKARPSRYDYMIPSQSSAGTNAIIWATQGYAVLDGASMYIIADGKDKEPNDVFLRNLVMDAEAAINYIDSAGIGDRERVAVSGHSYGGFMTANLLAHTKLFKAGIARSGAYNRTLTPYGFQSEGRSYWKAKAVYDEMSPFTYADSIKTPIMLIHGIMDDNSGTFPVQSERLYQAIKGQGGTVRYIQLPYEAHGYRAIENILHVLYETGAWMDKYMSKEAVENAKKKKTEDKTED